MALFSLLYVSHSAIGSNDADREIDRILASAHAHNPTVGLTGALLFTGTHFAQVLEGNEAAIDQLMASISHDQRHDQVTVVQHGPIAERQFSDWSMAYRGPSKFVSRHVTRLLANPSPAEQRRAAEWLTDLLREFSSDRDTAA